MLFTEVRRYRLRSRGPWLAEGFPKATLATCARSLPFRSPESEPRSTGRFGEPPASPRVPGNRESQPATRPQRTPQGRKSP